MNIRILAIMTVGFLLGGCYKVKNIPPDKSTPTYDIMTSKGYNLKNMGLVENIIQGDSSYIYLQFYLISGDPSNCNFSCYLSDFSNGITAKADTFNFKLNKPCLFHLYATTMADTGWHQVLLNVNSSINGHEQFPITLHIRAKP